MPHLASGSPSLRRVFMFVPNGIAGDSRVIKTVNSLRDYGFEVRLAGLHSGSESYRHLTVDGIEAVLVNNEGLSLRATQREHLDCIRSIAVRLLRVFRSFAPGILYTHDFMGLDVGGILLSRTSPDRPVCWFHDIHEYLAGYQGIIPDERLRYGLDTERRFLTLPHKLIFVNEAIRDLLCRKHSIDSDTCLVLHNVPRTQKSRVAEPLRQRLHLGSEVPLGVYIGRATKARGLDDIIPVLGKLPELHIALLSSASVPYLKMLRDQARHEGVEQRLHLLEYVPDIEIAATIKDADFGLCPLTRYGNSDLAIASKLYEYIHAGIPVIASDASLQSDFIRAHGTGWIYGSERPDELAEAIRKMLQGTISCTPDWRELRNTFNWRRHFAPVAEALLSVRHPLPLDGANVPPRYTSTGQPPGSTARACLRGSFFSEQKAASERAARGDWDASILSYAKALHIYPRDLGSLRGLAGIAESRAPDKARYQAAEILASSTHTFARSAGLTHDLYDFSAFLSEMRRAVTLGQLPLVDRLQSADLSSKPGADPAPPPRRLCLVTCVWRRPALTDLVLRHYSSLARSLQPMEITIVAAGSEGVHSRDLCEKHGVHYVETPNSPLSLKWEAALRHARRFEPDGAVIVGSDDLLDERLLRFYLRCLAEGDMFVGLLDGYFLELATLKLIHWRGFGDLAGQPKRINQTIGMGRCLSRKLLERIDYSLWSATSASAGLDRIACHRLASHGHHPMLRRDAVTVLRAGRVERHGQLAVQLAETGGLALDIKSAVAVTDFAKHMTCPSAYRLITPPWMLLEQHFPTFVVNDLRLLAEGSENKELVT